MTETVIGMKELLKKLDNIEDKLARKTLRSAALTATTSTMKEMKIKAPVGDKAHRTYTGRLVAPGFLRRNIARKTYIKDGKVGVMIGVRKEAWYGLLYTTGPHTVTQRGKTSVKPYTLDKNDWFTGVFIKNEDKIHNELKIKLRDKVLKAIR